MFSVRLKELREKAGYSQAQLARKLGVGQSTVGMWENGTNKPQNSSLEKMASIFNVTIDYLLGRPSTTYDSTKPNPNALRVPVLGTIPAGIPIEAIEEVLDWEELPIEMARGGKEYFGLRVSGDSMYPRYEDGDTIILRKQETCESGQDCAVMVNGSDATFKRVRINDNGIMLMPINPAYEPHFYSNTEVNELPVKLLDTFRQVDIEGQRMIVASAIQEKRRSEEK